MNSQTDVVTLTPDHEDAYGQFVARHPDALITYSLSYRNLLTDVLDCQHRYAMALRGGEVVGVMPLMSIRGPMGTVLNALPYFGSHGGALVQEAAAGAALAAWYEGEAMAGEVVAATVITNPLAKDRHAVVHDLAEPRVAHMTPLDGEGEPRERIWGRIEPSARRNVIKALRHGIEVAVENEAFAELELLHRRSMAGIGAQVKGADFFEGVRRHFRAGLDFDIYVARRAREAIAALLLFYSLRTVDYYVPALSPDHRSEQPMAAILIQAMVDAAGRGLSRWHWGGSWPSHVSLQRFKAKWGGIPCDYRYETKLNDPSLLRASRELIQSSYPNVFVVPFSALEAP